jgi:cellulose synthase/poly-beta-1,6-N-acetylglucosamine synthase-like glycosyltransferase
MDLLATSIVAAYFLVLSALGLYGAHRACLLRLVRRQRGAPDRPPGRLDPLPRVTVQIPIYNERYVVERVIRAACALQYPADRLEIQVLDDSTDDTTAIAASVVEAMRRRGHDILHLRRGTRRGYKAGALAHGLSLSRGEILAVFDADFVPGPTFLLDLIHHFSHPRVGMVQARWGHLNRDYSLLTSLQAIFLDGHFLIEHAARHRAGLFFNFNGTAGLWRRACIETSGGWRADTLTEDLDLSYRAQLAGWRLVFVPEVVAPAELPADIDAFRSQQQRWARGSIETGMRLLPPLLRARLPARVKLEALAHLTANLSYPLMVLLAILIVPAMILRQRAGWEALLVLDLPLFLLSTASVAAFYLASQRAAGADRAAALRRLPALFGLGVGLCLGNAGAALGALARRPAEFVRTPKHRLEGSRAEPRRPGHRGPGDAGDERPGYRGRRRTWLALVEAALGLYFAAAALYAAAQGMYATLPFLLLFQAGFLGTAVLSLRRASPAGRAPVAARAGPMQQISGPPLVNS